MSWPEKVPARNWRKPNSSVLPSSTKQASRICSAEVSQQFGRRSRPRGPERPNCCCSSADVERPGVAAEASLLLRFFEAADRARPVLHRRMVRALRELAELLPRSRLEREDIEAGVAFDLVVGNEAIVENELTDEIG